MAKRDLDTAQDDEGSSNSDDESVEDDDGEDIQIESLIAGRAKRSTAGNRLASLLDKEAADDELELLFAEDEDDVEFEGGDGEHNSDDQLSSDDDDDQGPAAAADDEFSGEKELQRAARATRLGQKRKANANFFKPQKRVKINPNVTVEQQETPGTTHTPGTTKSRKKPDRVSWMPAIEAEPIRASTRRLTMKSRESTFATMKEREERRVQTVAVMEAAAAKRGLSKPKTLTQAERLAEAARTEKANSKSLSRWEEAEEKRAAEQQARLTALHNRKIDGPVVSFWSGIAEWLNGKVRHVGKRPKEVDAVNVDADISGPKRKNGKQDKSMGPPPMQASETISTPGDTTRVAAAAAASTATPDSTHPESATSTPTPAENPPAQISSAVRDEPAASLPEAKDVASLTTATQTAAAEDAPAKVEQYTGMTLRPSSASGVSKTPAAPSPSPASAPAPNTTPHLPSPSKAPSPQKPSPQVEYSTRNLLTLRNFPPALEKAHPLIFKKPGPKSHLRPQKPTQELCAITSRPARYRDPTTGLPYYDAAAFRELRRLRAGAFRWSAMLQCYTGARGAAARGVPPRFLTPEVKRERAVEGRVPETPRAVEGAGSVSTTPAYTPTPALASGRRESARRKLAAL
ncbi:MAG: hypothetical protein M1829_001904 [Trizodia sp. TS-e1964]|nr:MAG: hypothetical protein M1829_001904 [Trizodia sp. TS-e1964]